MPKLTDRPKQKQSIAEAVWRVILNQGIQKASARNIAKEAGLSLGALRYYFSSQEELMVYAEQLIHAKLGGKVDTIFQDDLQPKTKILHVLLCLLPANEEREIETKIRMAMKIANAKGAGPANMEKDAAYSAIKNVVSYLALLNLLEKEADLSAETERLYAMINGLAIELSLRPEMLEKKNTKNLIMYHLNSICIEKFGEVE